jgi:hypothetical protein
MEYWSTVKKISTRRPLLQYSLHNRYRSLILMIALFRFFVNPALRMRQGLHRSKSGRFECRIGADQQP